jgi:hypothetical protein
MGSNNHKSDRTCFLAVGIVGAVLLLGGCATTIQPEPKRPISVKDWMGSTKQIVPAGDVQAQDNR